MNKHSDTPPAIHIGKQYRYFVRRSGFGGDDSFYNNLRSLARDMPNYDDNHMWTTAPNQWFSFSAIPEEFVVMMNVAGIDRPSKYHITVEVDSGGCPKHDEYSGPRRFV